VDPTTSDGSNALHLAVAARVPSLVSFLLDEGCNPDTPNSRGWTPLMLACHLDDVSVVCLLVSKGASKDRRNSEGRTVFDMAKSDACFSALEGKKDQCDDDEDKKPREPLQQENPTNPSAAISELQALQIPKRTEQRDGYKVLDDADGKNEDGVSASETFDMASVLRACRVLSELDLEKLSELQLSQLLNFYQMQASRCLAEQQDREDTRNKELEKLAID